MNLTEPYAAGVARLSGEERNTANGGNCMSVGLKARRQIALSGTSFLAAMLFAAGTGFAQPSNTPEPQSADETPGDTAASDEPTEKVVVTGTRIRGVPPTGSNLITVSRSDIETIGAANTPDLIATVPQLNSFNT